MLGKADRFSSSGIPSARLSHARGDYYDYGFLGIKGGVAGTTRPGLLGYDLWRSDEYGYGRDDYFSYAPTTHVWADYDGDGGFGHDYYNINGVDGSIVVPYGGTLLLGGQVLTLTDGTLEFGSYGTLGGIVSGSGLTITGGDYSYNGGGTFTINGTIESWHAAVPRNHSFVMPGSWNQGNLGFNSNFALNNGGGLSLWDTTFADSGAYTVSFSGNGLAHWDNTAGYVNGPPLLLVAPTVPGSGAGDVTAVTSEGEKIPWYEHIRYPRDGKRASRSAYALGDDADDADRDIRQKLRRRIDRLDFREIELADVIAFIREYSEANIHVNWRAMAAGVGRETKVTVTDLKGISVERALELVLEDVNGAAAGADAELRSVIDRGVLTISTRADLAREMIRRVYDVRDLVTPGPGNRPRPRRRRVAVPGGIFDESSTGGLFDEDPGPSRRELAIFGSAILPPSFRRRDSDVDVSSNGRLREEDFERWGIFDDEDSRPKSREQLGWEVAREELAEDLIDIIQNSIDRDSWGDPDGGGGGRGFVQALNGQFVVTQQAENHKKLARLLADMRKAKGIKEDEEKLGFFPGEAEAGEGRTGRTVRELGVRFDSELNLPRIVSGASA